LVRAFDRMIKHQKPCTNALADQLLTRHQDDLARTETPLNRRNAAKHQHNVLSRPGNSREGVTSPLKSSRREKSKFRCGLLKRWVEHDGWSYDAYNTRRVQPRSRRTLLDSSYTQSGREMDGGEMILKKPREREEHSMPNFRGVGHHESQTGQAAQGKGANQNAVLL
jgi:hypothetical protein